MKKAIFTLICLFAMMAAGTSIKAQEITISLDPGWNWISYPNTEAMTITAALGDFTPMQGDVIKSKGNGQSVYNNGAWRGKLTYLIPGSGYHYYSARTEYVEFVFARPASNVVVTATPTGITATSAVLGGMVILPEGTHVFLRGVCWGTESNPDIDGDHTTNGTGIGSFSGTLEDLNPNTTYYVRAYVVSDHGLAYGNEQSFTTEAGDGGGGDAPTGAQTITWTAADQGYENGQLIESVTFDDHVSAGFFQGTNSNNPPRYYNTGEAIRCYGGNYFTITSDYILTEITLGFASGEGSNEITTDLGNYADGTWTGSANEVTFTIGGTSGHRRIATFAITYSESGTPNLTITAANVEIAFDAISGSIEYTINNSVSGGELTASTTADWLSLGMVDTTIPFTCTANATAAPRTAAVTLTYTYNTDQTVTKNVTVMQAANPDAINNISDITATGTYTVQGTIVAKSARGFMVGDGTGYVYYYNANYTPDVYNIGDMVKLSGSVVVYGGVYEFNNSTTLTAAETSNYVAEDPIVITGEQMDARVASTTPPQLSSYVQYEGTLSINGTHYNITNINGATTAIGSLSYPLNVDEITALDGKQVKVTGYYVGISTSTYYSTMLGSLEEIASTEPSTPFGRICNPHEPATTQP